MTGKRTKSAIAGAVLCGLAAAPAFAGSTAPTAQDLQAQIASLKAQVAQMQQAQNQDWMTKERAAQVKSLVKQVLSDASTRSTLLQEGQTAGISEDGKIFLRSSDGSFEFSPSGEIQVRYIYNNRHEASAADGTDNNQGFQIRRARFIGDGHIGSPNIGYHFELSADNDGGNALFEDYAIYYQFNNGVKVTAGRFKQPFSREFLTSNTRQLAVERSIVDDFFGVGRSEGVMAGYKTDKWMVRGAFNNGSEAHGGQYADFYTAPADYAITVRGDYKVTGDWDQLEDSFNSWSGDGKAIFVGGAVDYENGRSRAGISGDYVHLLKYTVDASYQNNGLSVYVAGYGQNAQDDSDGPTFNDFGVVAQAGYFIVPDKVQPFVRYAGIYQDSDRTDAHPVNTLTLGVNWYQHRHMAKFTLDGVYVFNALNEEFTGAGLLGSDKSGQFAIRAQYQLLF